MRINYVVLEKQELACDTVHFPIGSRIPSLSCIKASCSGCYPNSLFINNGCRLEGGFARDFFGT